MYSGNVDKLIVIGTSAGGLNALSAILPQLPPGYAAAVVIVQHRSRDQKYLLEEVLQQKCRIRIKQADEKESISAGLVYIAPPDYHLLIEKDRTFSLASDAPVNYSRPSIDVLFESAALVYGSKLTGIVLTGASCDGADGLSIIRQMGGETIAQSPEDAEYPFMPKCAIENGAAKMILSLKEIVSYLLKPII